MLFVFFFFNDTATTEIYTLSLHDALPIFLEDRGERRGAGHHERGRGAARRRVVDVGGPEPRHARTLFWPFRAPGLRSIRSEEHTSELQSRQYLVCRLLLEKKKYLIHHG